MISWGKISLVLGLLVVVGMAFRVSWNALRDVAHAIGADATAALVYPLVVDGLMALALVSALVLPQAERQFALRVLAGYTAASLVLNYVHGLVPAIAAGGRVQLAQWAPANWALVLLATSLPVGSIFFGSDLVAKVLHHKPEPVQNAQVGMNRSVPELGESADPEPLPPVARPADPMPKPTAARPRRATGSVPEAAKVNYPTRTPDELLAEARELTADWPTNRLTADRLREALHVRAAAARTVREALKSERLAPTALHSVPAPSDDEGAA